MSNEDFFPVFFLSYARRRSRRMHPFFSTDTCGWHLVSFGCEHGAVLPYRTKILDELAFCISPKDWDGLVESYGGGPHVQSSEACVPCSEALKTLMARRKRELESVTAQLNNDKTAAEAGVAGPRYSIPTRWVDDWKRFVNCKGLEVLPPSAIDTRVLLDPKTGKLRHGSVHSRNDISFGLWSMFDAWYPESGPCVLVPGTGGDGNGIGKFECEVLPSKTLSSSRIGQQGLRRSTRKKKK